ncbi:Copper-exporting P-type ATPase A [Gemmata sp. SH-PL17]|uniref:heavy metal translocating P-type ATPase n=1 Tax=Gemmata sp. SH-PL17 TaxID=1630693 RepID=UPI00078C92EB|nr:cation-translocating P-type ATPase [Gemmata sp. SH-PL17]AMV29957.1 Copper-exporting P-type ATPase A [Gemmata sp. SH-PL17]
MPVCANCNGPITGSGYAGRPQPDGITRAYCCFGCLSLGERACTDAGCYTTAPGKSGRFDGLRLGIGVLVVGQSMIFGLALNVHDDVPPAIREFTQWFVFALTMLVVTLLGGPLISTAARELRRGRLTIEALFLLTMFGALGASLQAQITGRGKIYFEVVSVLLVVYTLGKVIGARSRAAALASSRAWGEQLATCRLVDDTGGTRTAPVMDVRPGDVVEIHPGELFAVDGVVRDGAGFVSETVVSGEPFAVVRRPGDRVVAGAASFDATFRVTATASGTEREIDRLLATVESARDKPLSLQGHADRLGQWFLPLVAFTAVGTFAYWTFFASAGWEAGLFNAMSVLLVACPCVIGLATPVVIWSALNRLAERGVIVRGGDAIERLATVDRVMFDKTGTLTEDRFALVDIQTIATGSERTKLLGWLSLAQSQSNHPIAKPFADLPRNFAPDAEPRVASLVAVPGCGVIAELVETNGTRHEIKIGTERWIGKELPEEPTPPAPLLTGKGEKNQTPRLSLNSAALLSEKSSNKAVFVAVDGELTATAVVAERLRDSTPQALEQFQQLGLPVEVLTGDAIGRAEALGLPSARGGLLPDDKRAAVEAAKQRGENPLFVGDGINDASALAVAHVGVALSSGTDLAVSAAPVTLYHTDLRALPWAVELSRDAVRAVRLNLTRALVYNLVGMTLAACGVLHPVVAAVLMVVSSLTLIFSSTRVGCGHLARPTPSERKGEKESAVILSPSPLGGGVGEGLQPQPNPLTPFPKKEGGTEPNTAALAPSSALSLFPSGRGDGGVGSLWMSFAHAGAFALQGGVFVLLLSSLRKPDAAIFTLTAFALAGGWLAIAWRRFDVPHWADMCFGMLTFGNLGMLLGWWADNDFAALHDHGCCACVEAMREGVMKPWMWVGMLVFANIAMRWLGRGPVPNADHAVAMYTGGNVGMVVGMVAGGWCATQFQTENMVTAVATSFVGMTLGMLAGMLAGTWVTESLLVGVRAVGFWPKWAELKATRTS